MKKRQIDIVTYPATGTTRAPSVREANAFKRGRDSAANESRDYWRSNWENWAEEQTRELRTELSKVSAERDELRRQIAEQARRLKAIAALV